MQNTIIKYWLIEPNVLIQKSKSRYLRYIFRYLLNWKAHYGWVEYLNSSKEMESWKKNYGPELYLKIQYPYLSGKFKPHEKLKYLKDHYDWLIYRINEKDYSQDQTLLWKQNIEIDDESQNLEIYLKYRAAFVSEGEIALVLKLNEYIQYTLTFSCIDMNGTPVFFIGGLQGGKPEITTLELVKKLTKQLYGLRPKQLMIHAISIMADFYEVNTLIGVSNKNHTFQSSRRKSKRERVKANLNDFWLNFDSTFHKDENYHFQPISNLINLEEIQSKKRNQYRNRQIILDELTSQCMQNLRIISKK